MSTSRPDLSPKNVVTLSPGILIACPGCEKSFEPRRPNHRYCSATCRLVWFHQKEVRARRERDAKVRLLLKPMLDTVQDDTVKSRLIEALALLEPENSRMLKKPASTEGLGRAISRRREA